MKLMALLLLITCYIIPQTTWAYMITQKGQSYFLEGKNCRDLIRPYRKLKEWKNFLGEPLKSSEEATFQMLTNNKTCRVDITAYLPQKIVELGLLDKTAPIRGPNCWNSVLLVNHSISGLHYIARPFFAGHLKTFCKERPLEEAPTTGDILAIKRYPNIEVHGAIYVDRDLIFSKNGLTETAPYTFYRSASIFSSYKVNNPICQRQSTLSPSKRCPVYATYYTCPTTPLSQEIKLFQKEWESVEELSKLYTNHILLNHKLDEKSFLKKLSSIKKTMLAYPLPHLEKGLIIDFIDSLSRFADHRS